MPKPQCCVIDSLFDEKTARKQLKKYKRGKLDKATELLLLELRKHELAEKSLLDVGSGIGVIPLELHKDGIGAITDVDASSGYIQVAKEEAQHAGTLEKTKYLFGNFVELADELESHDVATLDKVICCFDDAENILKGAASNSHQLVGLVYPRRSILTILLQAIGRVYFRIRNWGFRFHMHPQNMIDRVFTQHGFKEVALHKTLLWQVRVFQKG